MDMDVLRNIEMLKVKMALKSRFSRMMRRKLADYYKNQVDAIIDIVDFFDKNTNTMMFFGMSKK